MKWIFFLRLTYHVLSSEKIKTTINFLEKQKKNTAIYLAFRENLSDMSFFFAAPETLDESQIKMNETNERQKHYLN